MRTAGAWRTAAVLTVCLSSGQASATTNKCVDDAGHVTFSNLPCPVRPAPPSATPATPPCALTADERKLAERQERQFLLRFPDEARHRAASLAKLQEIVARLRLAQIRFADLMRERKSIDDGEFYKGKPLPTALAGRLDANEAKFAAMAEVFGGERNAIESIMTIFWCERTQFAMLWQGGAPGSSACAGRCKT